jgi:hypothetical protein
VGNGAREPDGPSDLGIEETVLEALKKALADIEYGSVLLKIHQGQVVGIETSTKLRLND